MRTPHSFVVFGFAACVLISTPLQAKEANEAKVSGGYYTFSPLERFNVNVAVTNYQSTRHFLCMNEVWGASFSRALKLGINFDIAAVNAHRNINVRSTYYELGMRHDINSRFSISTRMGMNRSDSTQFYDYAISGEYALTNILSVTVGYAEQTLNSTIKGEQAFVGARLTF